MTFTAPSGATHHRAWTEVQIIELLSTATKSGRAFDGILIVSPIGPVRLEDTWYTDGRKVAGAVLKRLDELGIPVGQSR